MKAFWGRLVEEAGLDLSYASARTYHYDRTPPLSYIIAVSQTFDVSLEWLAVGGSDLATERELWSELGERWERVGSALLEGFFGSAESDGEDLGDALPQDLVRLWRRARVWTMTGRSFPSASERRAYELELARKVGEAAGAPLRAFGIDPAGLGYEDADQYLKTVLPAFVFAERLDFPHNFDPTEDDNAQE